MIFDPFVNPAYQPLFCDDRETQKRIVMLIGGRNSGKSRAKAQRRVKRMLEKKRRIAFVRNVADSIRDSMYKEVQDVVSAAGLDPYFTFTGNPLSIRSANGSEVVCKGCDAPEKLKSLAEVDEVEIEELNEISQEAFDVIDFSVRGESRNGDLKQIICSQNTVKSFAKEHFYMPDGITVRYPDQVYSMHTTWRDNYFCGEDWQRRMDILKEQNEQLWKMVSEGMWTEMEGLVYRYELCDAIPEQARLRRRGLDFGGNDPSAVLDVAFFNGAFYVDELIYGSGLTSDSLPEKMKASLWESRNVKILADNSYKMQIDAMHLRGWNVHPCEKWNIEDRSMWLSSFPIHVTRRSSNVIREIESYVWAKDKAGKALNVPVAWNDHAMDALMYAALDMKPYTVQTVNTIEHEAVHEGVTFEQEEEDEDEHY